MGSQAGPQRGSFRGDAADSGNSNVELEDDKVRILRIRYGPGEKYVMRGHPAMIGIFLGDASFCFTYPDGRSEHGTATAGQVMRFEALEHLGVNTSDQPFEMIALELKPSIPVSPYQAYTLG
jgi:hypothetical protein